MRTTSFIPLLAAIASRTSAQTIVDLLSGNENLSSLLAAVQQFPDLVTALGAATDITIFAPNNAAFANLPEGLDDDTVLAVLNYHVVSGVFRSGDFTDDNQALTTLLVDNPQFVNVTQGQVLNAKLDEGTVLINDDFMVSFAGNVVEAQAQVTDADITFDSGVVHIINAVLIPPTDIVTTLGTRQTDDVDLSTLLQVLGGSGVAGTVAGASDVTLFAPNNPAWEGVDTAALTSEQVDNILKYHVVQSENVAYASRLQSGTFKTLQGEDITVDVVDEDNITVNGNRVILADILTANGVVHVIDGILQPTTDGTDDTPDDDDDAPVDDDDDDDTDDDPETVNSASTLSYAAWALVAGFLVNMAL